MLSSDFNELDYPNFKDAYWALHNKMSKNNTGSMILPKFTPYGTNQSIGSQLDPKRFEKLHQEKLGKIHMKVKEESILQILEEEKELTFHPKINNPFNRKKRSVEEFLNDMVTELMTSLGKLSKAARREQTPAHRRERRADGNQTARYFQEETSRSELMEKHRENV